MRRRLRSLSWDGHEMVNTDMSWLGDKILIKLFQSLQNKISYNN